MPSPNLWPTPSTLCFLDMFVPDCPMPVACAEGTTSGKSIKGKAARQLRSNMETARTAITETRKGSTDVPTSIGLQLHQSPWPVTDEKVLFSASNLPSLLTTSRTP